MSSLTKSRQLLAAVAVHRANHVTMLRSCLALPKVAFVLRSCPPNHVSNATFDFDVAIRDTLRDIVGGPLSDWSWLKASLPCSRGGLGLRNASLHAPAAFLASLHSQSLVERMFGHPPCTSSHTSPAIAALAAVAARPDWQGLDNIGVSLSQHSLSLSIDVALHQHLISSAPSTRSRALALSTGLPHACDWLNVVPSSLLGLRLQDREFRCCLCYWLGVPLNNGQFTCPECRGSADPFGDYQVGCGGNGDRISRHNAIRDVVFSAAQSAALALSKEAPNLVPDSSVRPADVLLPNWNRGRPAAVDVHVISPLQQQTLAEAASTPGHALQVGVRGKLVSNLSACRSVGVEFVPFVIETLASLSEDTISTIRAIGRSVGQRSGTSDPSCTSKHLFGHVAIVLWRGNASLWLHRHPTLPPSLDGLM